MKKAAFGGEFSIALHESVNVGDELEVRLTEITEELIAASPDGIYPPGNGATISLELKAGDERTSVILELVSEGYTSKPEAGWKGFSVMLLDADLKSAKIRIDKAKNIRREGSA